MTQKRGLAVATGLALAMTVVATAAWASRSSPTGAVEGQPPATGPVRHVRPATWGSSGKPGFSEMAFAPDGTLYATDCGNARIYRVTPGRPGVTKVIAGRGPGGFFTWSRGEKVGWIAHHAIAGDGGPPTNAIFNCPMDLDFDEAGNMYFSDLNNGRIREITTDNVVGTFAGLGPGFPFRGPWTAGIGPRAGDGGPASHAILRIPSGIAFDANGSLFIADRDHEAIRRIDTNGIITTVAGTGHRGYNGDNQLASNAELFRPVDVAFDAAGNLYVSDENNRRIRMVDRGGIITTVAGTGKYACGGDGGKATEASFRNPGDILFLPDGSLLLSDGECHAIRRISPTGKISTYAGGTNLEHPCRRIFDSPVRALPVPSDMSLTLTPRGEVLIGDGVCRDILRVDVAGIVHLFARAPHSRDTP